MPPAALVAAALVAICAKFMLNLSFSSFSSFSFFFIAPGLLLRLFLCIFACPTTTSPLPSPSSKPDRASASDSRFVTSFLFGRRRFWIFEEDFSILPTNAECLIVRLSLLDDEKGASSVGVGRVTCGRAARADFARAEVRFVLVIGAWNNCQYLPSELAEPERTIVTMGERRNADFRLSCKAPEFSESARTSGFHIDMRPTSSQCERVELPDRNSSPCKDNAATCEVLFGCVAQQQWAQSKLYHSLPNDLSQHVVHTHRKPLLSVYFGHVSFIWARGRRGSSSPSKVLRSLGIDRDRAFLGCVRLVIAGHTTTQP
jgi:hypothetical protein